MCIKCISYAKYDSCYKYSKNSYKWIEGLLFKYGHSNFDSRMVHNFQKFFSHWSLWVHEHSCISILVISAFVLAWINPMPTNFFHIWYSWMYNMLIWKSNYNFLIFFDQINKKMVMNWLWPKFKITGVFISAKVLKGS